MHPPEEDQWERKSKLLLNALVPAKYINQSNRSCHVQGTQYTQS